MHTKCMCGAIWLTNMRFKQRLDQVYQAGVRNLDLTFVVKRVAWPVIMVLSLSIVVPYIIFMGVCHDLGTYVHKWIIYIHLQNQCTAVFSYALYDNCSAIVHVWCAWCHFPNIYFSLSLSLSICPLLYPTGLVSYNNALFLYRFFYPFILLSLLATIVVLIIIKQCKRLYRHVRNEK